MTEQALAAARDLPDPATVKVARPETHARPSKGRSARAFAWLFFVGLPVAYLILWGLSEISMWAMDAGWLMDRGAGAPGIGPVFAASFVVFFWPLLYLFNSAMAGRLIRLNLSSLVLYMGAVLWVGLFGEVVGDAVWNRVFGQPLWLYRVWPLHHGYTSGVSIAMWPLYGFHLWCLHQVVRIRPELRVYDNDYAKGLFIGIDALALEVVANIFSLWLFHTYYFYYLPGDLNHFASIQNFPAYFLCGIVAVKVIGFLNRFQKARLALGIFFYATGVYFVRCVLS